MQMLSNIAITKRMTERIAHSPEALKFYREQVSLSKSLLASKSQVKLEQIEAGEVDSHVFTFRQLQRIAKRLFIPEFLLLNDNLQPKDIPKLIDYRNNENEGSEEANYLLQKAIHEVVNGRDNLLYTYEILDIEPNRFELSLEGNNASSDAIKIRQFLGADESKIKQDNSDDYYRGWRTLLERQDVLVFEVSGIKFGSEGMALHYGILPIIALLSSGQSNSRKLFTMMHELTHLGLRQSAVDGGILQSSYDIERYCNLVAGHVLVPEPCIEKYYNPSVSLDENVRFIRKKLKVSKEAIAIQLRLTNRINRQQLDDYLNQLNSKQGFGRTGKQYTAYNQFGKVYIQQVLSAVMSNDISASSAIKILKLNNVEQLNYLEQRVFV